VVRSCFGRPEKNNRPYTKDIEALKEKIEKSKSSDIRVVSHSPKMVEDRRRIKEALAV
jgi:hypothetical protein